MTQSVAIYRNSSKVRGFKKLKLIININLKNFQILILYMLIKKTRRSYTVEQKLLIIGQLRLSCKTISEFGKKINIPKKTIEGWITKEYQMNKVDENKKKIKKMVVEE